MGPPPLCHPTPHPSHWPGFGPAHGLADTLRGQLPPEWRVSRNVHERNRDNPSSDTSQAASAQTSVLFLQPPQTFGHTTYFSRTSGPPNVRFAIAAGAKLERNLTDL